MLHDVTHCCFLARSPGQLIESPLQLRLDTALLLLPDHRLHSLDAGHGDLLVLGRGARAAAHGAEDDDAPAVPARAPDGHAAADDAEAAAVGAVDAVGGAAGPDGLAVGRGGQAVAGGREGLVHGDGDGRQLGAGHALEVEQVCGAVHYRYVHGHTDLVGLGLAGLCCRLGRGECQGRDGGCGGHGCLCNLWCLCK